jgi:hypothetical protein
MRRSPLRGDALSKDRAIPGRSLPSPSEPLNKKSPEAPPATAPQWTSGSPDKKDAEGVKESALGLRRRRPPWCPPEDPCPPDRPPWCPPERPPVDPPWCPPEAPCPPGEPLWCPPGGPSVPGGSPCPGPWPPGSTYPGGRTVQLAEAFVPWQVYNGYCPPGQMAGPGTIFPELLRHPPLYQYPPGTGGRRG